MEHFELTPIHVQKRDGKLGCQAQGRGETRRCVFQFSTTQTRLPQIRVNSLNIPLTANSAQISLRRENPNPVARNGSQFFFSWSNGDRTLNWKKNSFQGGQISKDFGKDEKKDECETDCQSHPITIKQSNITFGDKRSFVWKMGLLFVGVSNTSLQNFVDTEWGEFGPSGCLNKGSHIRNWMESMRSRDHGFNLKPCYRFNGSGIPRC